MQKKLFFCCSSADGGREAILRELGGALAGAGGFITRQAIGADGALLGLDLLPAAAAAGVDGFHGARFLDFTAVPPKTDNDVFRLEAVRLLQEAPYYPFTLLDSLGSFELVIPLFREALSLFLSADVPCVGIVKPLDETELMRSFLGLGERMIDQAIRLRASLESDADTLVIDVDDKFDERGLAILRQWARAYVR